MGDGLRGDEDPEWAQAITAIRSRYLPAGLARTGRTDSAGDADHAEVLRASAFSSVHTRSWTWERELTLDEAVGL